MKMTREQQETKFREYVFRTLRKEFEEFRGDDSFLGRICANPKLIDAIALIVFDGYKEETVSNMLSKNTLL
jgi:hypothetical protein